MHQVSNRLNVYHLDFPTYRSGESNHRVNYRADRLGNDCNRYLHLRRLHLCSNLNFRSTKFSGREKYLDLLPDRIDASSLPRRTSLAGTSKRLKMTDLSQIKRTFLLTSKERASERERESECLKYSEILLSDLFNETRALED